MSETFTGLLEIDERRLGFLRRVSLALVPQPNDPFVAPPLIQQHNLRSGVLVEAEIIPGNRGGQQVGTILRVNGLDPAEWAKLPELE
ncbi:MAG: transcription termination factor Rho, partial [bacterium]